MSKLLKCNLTLVTVAFIAFIVGIIAVSLWRATATRDNAIATVLRHKHARDMSREERGYGSPEQINAAQIIRRDRSKTIRQLIEAAARDVEPLVSNDKDRVRYPRYDSKHLAILLLGDFRAGEAVPVLLDNLEYRNPREIPGGFPDIDALYPAAEALSKIGMPAVQPLIEKLAGYEPNSIGSKICKWILREIMGIRLARLRLQIAIKEARDTTVKQNLTAALSYFKTDQEKAAEERARRKKATG